MNVVRSRPKKSLTLGSGLLCSLCGRLSGLDVRLLSLLGVVGVDVVCVEDLDKIPLLPACIQFKGVASKSDVGLNCSVWCRCRCGCRVDVYRKVADVAQSAASSNAWIRGTQTEQQ